MNSEDRCVWARFMMAQWLRSPEELSRVKSQCADILRANFDANPEEYLAERGDAPEATLREYIDARMPGHEEIIIMTRMLPQGIDHDGIGATIINMFWEIIDLRHSQVDLLTSDRPVIRLAGLAKPDAAIMIPLDPRHLFVATHADCRFRDRPHTKLAKDANTSTVLAAKAYVYGTGPQHMPLVEKYLAKAQ